MILFLNRSRSEGNPLKLGAGNLAQGIIERTLLLILATPRSSTLIASRHPAMNIQPLPSSFPHSSHSFGGFSLFLRFLLRRPILVKIFFFHARFGAQCFRSFDSRGVPLNNNFRSRAFSKTLPHRFLSVWESAHMFSDGRPVLVLPDVPTSMAVDRDRLRIFVRMLVC